ncbi:MAG TPA: beta-galactosidase trimerization domain-containing protein, partial [Candidatus Acidoferrales bacterium]|nr:beta-galactosidase trimerization domain-containing protein [Candidatus Acidoferrales bacterium]
GGRQRATSYGGPQGEVAGIERDSLLGVYRALFPRNVPIDYVHVNELSALAQYKLVILPYPVMLPEAAAAPLKEYVRNGGALVAEARLGWSNERGTASERIPGMGLWELMGCRETAVQTGERGRTTIEWLTNHDRIPARWFGETLEPIGEHARVVARFANGDAAGVESAFGKGKTLALGSYVSAAYENAPSRETERFYAGLLDWAGIALPLTVTGGRIEARLLESGAERLVFVFNHDGQTVDATVNLAGSAPLQKRMSPNEVWFVRVP